MKLYQPFAILLASLAGLGHGMAQDQIIAPVAVILENQRPNGAAPGPWIQYGNPLGEHWYNSTGLSTPLATGDLVPSPLPTHEPYAIPIVSRVRDTEETTTSGEAQLVFDLGGSFNLSGVALWNSNENNQTQRGIENMALSYSTDGGLTFSPGETLSSWTQGANGTIDGEVMTLTNPSSAQDVTHVRMLVDNFSGEPIVTFVELRLIGVPGALPPLLQWASGDDDWTAAEVWQNEAGAPATFSDGLPIEFEDTLSGASPVTVTLNDTVAPGGITASNASKDFIVTGSGSITGTTTLSKEGTGTLTLATANDYSGGTTVSLGQLNIDNASALGSGPLTITEGSLDNTSGQALTNVNDNEIELGVALNFLGSSDLDLGAGAVSLNGITTINVDASTLTLGGTIGGVANAALIKTGVGTLSIAGTNTYPGNTTIDEGVLEITGGDAFADASRVVINEAGTLVLNQDETVNSLFFGISPQPAGTYAAPGVTGVDFNDARLSGSSILTVLDTELPEILFWDIAETSGFQKGNGNWNLTESNWSPEGSNLFPWNPNTPANFGGDDSSATITVTEDLSAAQLNFLNDGYTLMGDAAPRTIALTNGNIETAPSTTAIIGNNLTLTSQAPTLIGQNTAVDAGSLTFLTGSEFVKTGAGDLTIDGLGTEVTVSGSLLVSDGLGRIHLGSNATRGTDVSITIEGDGVVATETAPNGGNANNVIQLGFASGGISDPSEVRGTITVTDNGILRAGTGGDRSIRVGQFGTGVINLDSNGLVQASSIVLGNGGNGTGFLNASGGVIETGSLFFNKSNSVGNFDGATIRATDGLAPLIRNGDGLANILDGGLTIDTNGFDTSADEDLIDAGTLGTGGFTKTGEGTLTVAAAWAHPGTTVIDEGTLLVTESWGSATGDVIVNNQATLGGNDLIGGNVTVTAAASIAPGPLAGTLLTGDLDLSQMAAGSGTLAFDLDAIGLASDLIDALELNIGSDVLGLSDFAFNNLGGLQEGTYPLLISRGVTGTLDANDLTGVIIPGFLGELQLNGSNLEVVVSIDPNGVSSFITWALENGLDGTAGRESGPNDDPDNDGLSNIGEFAFNGNPLSSADNGQIGFIIQDGSAPVGDEFTLVVAVRDGATFASSGSSPNVVQTATVDGVTYTIEGSLDLQALPNADVSLVGGPLETAPVATGLLDLTDTEWEYHSFKLDASESLAAPRGFMRANASEAP